MTTLSSRNLHTWFIRFDEKAYFDYQDKLSLNRYAANCIANYIKERKHSHPKGYIFTNHQYSAQVWVKPTRAWIEALIEPLGLDHE